MKFRDNRHLCHMLWKLYLSIFLIKKKRIWKTFYLKKCGKKTIIKVIFHPLKRKYKKIYTLFFSRHFWKEGKFFISKSINVGFYFVITQLFANKFKLLDEKIFLSLSSLILKYRFYQRWKEKNNWNYNEKEFFKKIHLMILIYHSKKTSLEKFSYVGTLFISLIVK